MTSRNNKGSNPNPSIHIHGGVAHLICFQNREPNTYYRRKQITHKTVSLAKTQAIHAKIRLELLAK